MSSTSFANANRVGMIFTASKTLKMIRPREISHHGTGLSPQLSAQDRLTLIQTLNALPLPQFNELVFALNPPNANLPNSSAPQGDRTTALLKWAESPIGSGLPTLEEILSQILGKASHTADKFLSFAIAGKLGDMSPDELQAIVELLRKKTGDNSIEIAFSREGSIKLILSGSPDGLNKLQELFDSGEVEIAEIPPVENVQNVDNTTTDARKARLIQALRLRRESQVLIHTHTLDRISTLNRALDRTITIAIVSALLSIISITIASSIASIITIAIPIVGVITIVLALDRAHDHTQTITRYQTEIQQIQTLDLRNADLSGTDLRALDLSTVDITNADVTKTIFGDNKGLTESDKENLENLGAIFLEPPGSDVPQIGSG